VSNSVSEVPQRFLRRVLCMEMVQHDRRDPAGIETIYQDSVRVTQPSIAFNL